VISPDKTEGNHADSPVIRINHLLTPILRGIPAIWGPEPNKGPGFGERAKSNLRQEVSVYLRFTHQRLHQEAKPVTNTGPTSTLRETERLIGKGIMHPLYEVAPSLPGNIRSVSAILEIDDHLIETHHTMGNRKTVNKLGPTEVMPSTPIIKTGARTSLPKIEIGSPVAGFPFVPKGLGFTMATERLLELKGQGRRR